MIQTMLTPERIQAARLKAEATRVRNLLRKEAEYFVLSSNEARILRRLINKKHLENRSSGASLISARTSEQLPPPHAWNQ